MHHLTQISYEQNSGAVGHSADSEQYPMHIFC